MNLEAIKNAAKKVVEPNWENKTLFLGDNLPIMRRLNSGLIDLIYLDPPFNSNRKYRQPIGDGGMREVFKDIWRETDLDKAEAHRLADGFPALYSVIQAAREAHGGSMFSYLLMMAPRLIECRRLLKETGSIYLHCDPTASHYLKMIMDAIFGKDNFRNEIVWCYEKPRPSKHKWRANHDYILFYVNGEGNTFNTQRVPTKDGKFEMRKPFKRPDGTIWKPKEPGKAAGSWWADIPSFATAMSAKERSGYPTQKPQALLERIIQASSNEGDWVFDPFCGCATTLVAAEKLNRRWLGIDVSEQSAQEIKKRMIKLAIDRGENELAIWKGIHNRDLRTAKQLDRLDRTEWGKLPHPRTHKKWLYGEQRGYCAGCGKHFEERHLEIDHYVPKSKGGTDHRSNLQLLCGACNRMKGDRPQAYLENQLKKLGITLH